MARSGEFAAQRYGDGERCKSYASPGSRAIESELDSRSICSHAIRVGAIIECDGRAGSVVGIDWWSGRTANSSIKTTTARSL